YVRTAKARSNIRHFLKTMQYEESAGLGERLLDQAIKALNGSLAEVDDASWERVVRDGGARSREELLADIGLGKRLPAVVARRCQAAINAMVESRRGVLAKVASEIAEAGSNIDSITMAEDRAVFTSMHFVVEVANRQHLARVMRALRRLPDVKKITRVRE